MIGRIFYNLRGVWVVCAMLLCSVSMHSQNPNGEIRLEVKDPSGAPVEASGRLESVATGVDRTFQTDAQGRATLDRLSYGRYRLAVSKTGFATQTVFIDVPSEAPVAHTVTLTLGASAYRVDVVATTPLPGVDRFLNEIPTLVQTASERDIERSGALELSDFLNRRLAGVHLNEVAGNPFQADLNYRGYTASPLLGTPQGLSVYLEGVRINQPFGDVVSWDLIPRIAISEVTLMPGSNPLFGLNTLGGALSIQTKDGRRQPGTSVEVSGGRFGRGMVEFEHGGANAKGLNWYLASALFFEDGWREASPSNVRQFFGKLGWQGAKTVLGLTAAYANNLLNGNALQEQRFLARDYTSVYTKPDITRNRSPFFNLSARHSATNSLTFSGNVYYRHIRAKTSSADLNENSLDEAVYQPSPADQRALAAAGYTGFPTRGENATNTPFPFWRCIAQALRKDEPIEKCNALLNRTRAAQHNYGVSGQMSWFGSPHGHRNQLTTGAAYDRSRVGFQQSMQFGYLNPDRSVTPVDAFADGTTNRDGVPVDTRVDLEGRIHTGSFYATDTLSIGNAWSVTLSGRYNRTTIHNGDRIRPGGGPGSLNGNHVFDRFNPAVGVTFSPWRRLNAYASYSEGVRAPTSIELGCADPNQPCKLPNAMATDPPLHQVVTRTWEAGLRAGLESNLSWNIGWFRAGNRDDILFVASTATGFGYFKNFGKTLRQGLDIGVNSRIGRFSLVGGYTFLDATYQSPERVNGSSNSTNDTAATLARGLDGTTRIRPGDRIPLIPQHMLKAFADVQVTSRLLVDLGMVALSRSYARGNENNRHSADGIFYLGPGTSPGYAVVNLGGRYHVSRRLELFARVNNLFNRHYFTAAQLGPTGFTDAGTFIARPFPAVRGQFPIVHATFYAPGAPRGAWGGVRFKL